VGAVPGTAGKGSRKAASAAADASPRRAPHADTRRRGSSSPANARACKQPSADLSVELRADVAQTRGEGRRSALRRSRRPSLSPPTAPHPHQRALTRSCPDGRGADDPRPMAAAGRRRSAAAARRDLPSEWEDDGPRRRQRLRQRRQRQLSGGATLCRPLPLAGRCRRDADATATPRGPHRRARRKGHRHRCQQPLLPSPPPPPAAPRSHDGAARCRQRRRHSRRDGTAEVAVTLFAGSGASAATGCSLRA